MVSRTDEETHADSSNDVILLAVHANPDGRSWSRTGTCGPEKLSAPLREPAQRSMNNLPRLYQKYIGHDNNRDFYMSNMNESTNMNRSCTSSGFRRSCTTTTRRDPPAR